MNRNDNYNIVKFIGGESLFDINTLNEIEKKSHNCNNKCEHKHSHTHHGIQSIFIKGKTSLNSQKEI